MKWKLVFIPLMLVIFSLNVFIVSAGTVYPNGHFDVGNVNYSVSAPMNFNYIRGTDEFICFNDVYFNVSSSSSINITMSYLANDVLGAADEVRVLRFSASTPSGLVWFNLSGFKPGYEYNIVRSGEALATVYADNLGVISFSNDAWSSHTFDVYQGDSVHYAYLINDTNGASNYCDFIFSNQDYDSLSFYFKTNSSHGNCSVYVKDSDNVSLCHFWINASHICFNGSGWDQAVSDGTWYRVLASFDWNVSTVTGDLYSASSLLKSGSVSFNSGLSNISVFNVSGVSGSAAYVWFDNLAVSIVTADGDVMMSSIRGYVHDSIAPGFESLGATGSYLPLIVLGVVMFMVLGLILGFGLVGGPGSKNGGSRAL